MTDLKPPTRARQRRPFVFAQSASARTSDVRLTRESCGSRTIPLAECARKFCERSSCCCVDAKKTLETSLKSTETELAHCKGDLKAVRAELCCCVDAKNVEGQLKLAEAEIGHTSRPTWPPKSGERRRRRRAWTRPRRALKSTEDDLASKKKDLAVCQAQATDKNEKLIECHSRVCCLEKELATAQATALGAARELACCKHDCPAAIFNSPMLARGRHGSQRRRLDPGGANPRPRESGGARAGGAGGSGGGSGATAAAAARGGSGAGGSGAGGSGGWWQRSRRQRTPVVLPDHPGAEAVAAASEAFLEECWAESSVRNGLRRKHSFLGKARTL